MHPLCEGVQVIFRFEKFWVATYKPYIHQCIDTLMSLAGTVHTISPKIVPSSLEWERLQCDVHAGVRGPFALWEQFTLLCKLLKKGNWWQFLWWLNFAIWSLSPTMSSWQYSGVFGVILWLSEASWRHQADWEVFQSNPIFWHLLFFFFFFFCIF